MAQTASISLSERAPEDIIQDELNDFEIWCHKYWRILHERSRVFAPFVWNPIQCKVNQNWGQFNVFCKPRKVGGTTFGIAKIAHIAFTKPNSLSFVIANNKDLALDILQRIVLSHKNMPDAVELSGKKIPIKPVLFRDNSSKGHIIFCWDYSKGKNAKVFSTIEAGSANSDWSTGRGSHPDAVLFTEAGLPEYHDGSTFDAVMSSLRNDTAITMESSPFGAGGPMWEKFMSADWSSFMPGSRPATNDWIAHFPTFKDYPDYRREPTDGEDINPQNEFEEELIERYRCSIKQMLWARWKVRNTLASDNSERNPYDTFHQEFPVDPMRCWLVAGNKFFDGQMLASRMERAQVYCSVDNTHGHPGYKRLVTLHRRRARTTRTGNMYIEKASAGAWQFVECPEHPRDAAYGEVAKHRTYLITADPADGGDDSAMMIWDKTAMNADRCIALYKNKVSIVDFAKNCFAAWQWFGKPLFMHENNNHGHALTLALTNMGMSQSAFFRMQKSDEGRLSRSFSDRLGFTTSAPTKPRILNLLWQMLQTEYENPESDYGLWIPFVDFWVQATNFVNEKGKLKGSGKTSDDLVMCAALAAYAMYNERAVRAPVRTDEKVFHELEIGQLVPHDLMKAIDMNKINEQKSPYTSIGRLN
jgi:hypothetical protein